MSQYDYMIVGYGLSGAILTDVLSRNGKKILIIDKFNKNSSSQVAAGLVNPVTGRRVVKSWMADELIPFAKNYYREIEKETGTKFFHEIDLLEFIHSVKDINDWTARMSEPEMSKYLDLNPPENSYDNIITSFQKIFRITSSGWMNIPFFIDVCKSRVSESVSFINDKFEYESLRLSASEINYKEHSAGRIIFCEGHETLNNPLWNWLPFLPAKGEILTISCNELPEDFILMSGIFVIPLGNKKFRVGSTYEWNFQHEEPTESGKQKLIRLIDDFLKVPYEITDHRAGIRPTVKDRRPIIGRHPAHSNVMVFNGMGTKGVQLAPYFAHHFYDFLEAGSELNGEINVQRFSNS